MSRFKFILKRGIFVKIFGMMMLVSLATGAILLSRALIEQTRFAERMLIEENELRATILSQIVITDYLRGRWPFQTFKSVSEAEEILFLWIVKPDGEIYYADDPEKFGTFVQEPALLGGTEIIVKDFLTPESKEKIKLIVHPLKLEIGEPTWGLFLGVSMEPVESLKKEIIFTGLIIFLIAIILITLISFYFSRAITKPLGQLQIGVEKISKGNLDYRVGIKTGDEIEELGKAFNQMAGDLKQYHAALEESKNVLEIKVRARTKELRELAGSLDEQVKTRTKELEDSKTALMNTLKYVEEAREKAEEEKNKTNTIITNFADGLLFFDEKNKLSLINPRAKNFLGIKEKEIVGKFVSEFTKIPKLKPLFEIVGKEIQGVFRRELEIRQSLILEVSTFSILREKKKIGSLITLHDITREKRIERMKTEFVSLAAHQLRTPLSAIKWTLKMLLTGDLGKITEEQKEFIEKSYNSNERMINLINELLDITRIEEGRYVLNPQFSQMENIVQFVINTLREEIKKKKIKFDFERPEKKLPRVKVDVEKIRLAINNLIDNAIRYTSAGGKVTVSLKHSKKEVEFSVEDTGIGVPKNQKGRIFTKFFRGANVMRMETEGTGLGLYIVKNVIEAHNGRIWFKSTEGKGTTFYFALPTEEKVEEF